jgi:vitamin B12 transporter
MSPILRPLAVLALFVSSFAYPQSDEVVVTATRTPQRVNQLVSDVTVITRDQIEQTGHSSLVEILQAQPGMQITSTGGLGTTTSVFMRGTNSDHVVVLMDGVRVGSATAGTTAFENIPPSQIERIEIVRGPMSSLYGADAIGGVIQIFTRRSDGPVQPRGSAGYGSYHTQAYTAGVGGTVGDTSFNINAGYLSSRGFSAIREADPAAFFDAFNPDDDGYRNKSASARIAHRFAKDQELGGTFFWSDGRTHVDFSGRDSDDIQDQTLQTYTVYSRNRLLPAWLSTLRLGRSEDDSTIRSAFGTGIFDTVQDQAVWQNDFTTPLGDVLVAGEYLDQKVTSTEDFAVKSRTIWSLLAGYTARWRDHTLQASARRDDNSQFGDKTTGALGYGHSFARGLRISASYGTAFKAPSFNQLYFPGFGNPDLRPESSRNIEGAIRYERDGHSAGIVAYRNEVRDLIVLVANPATGLLFPENVNTALITGVTLTYGMAVGNWSVRASADFQNPEDETTGQLLPRRSREYGSIAVSRNVQAWLAGIEVVASGPRFDDTANTQRMGGYTLFNLFGEYRIDKGWSIFGRVNNFFDKQYELVQRFGTSGFNAFLGVRYEPK